MPLMQEAVSRVDWELMEQGKKPKKRPQIIRPEPERPELKSEIKFTDIPAERFKKLDSAIKNIIKNKEGMRFIGYDVLISLGRPDNMIAITDEEKKAPKSMSGWMDEGNFLQLVRTFRKKIDVQVIRW
ncbi:MAG TPA: hypothetical protein VJ343_00165 [archaeon]|nr:hypothetical protein [archaeon]